jgi:hypothetical protein
MNFKTTVWSVGKVCDGTGSGYGINIPKRIIDEFFQKHWQNLELILGGSVICVSITPAFWSQCNEVRSPQIGLWLIKNGVHEWVKGTPTKLRISEEHGRKFRVKIL